MHQRGQGARHLSPGNAEGEPGPHPTAQAPQPGRPPDAGRSHRAQPELTRTLRDNQREGSLLSVLDRTVTPMERACSTTTCSHRSRTRRLSRPASTPWRNSSTTTSSEARFAACSKLRGYPAAHDAGLDRAGRPEGPRRHRPHAPRLAGRKGKVRGPSVGIMPRSRSSARTLSRRPRTLDKSLADDPPFVARDGGVIRAGYNRLR